MPTVITGTDGINQVQTGAVESGDLPAGSVIQVVQTVKDDVFSSTSGTFVDVTGLSASITPTTTSSKIYVNVCISNLVADGGDGSAEAILIRDTTQIANASSGGSNVLFGGFSGGGNGESSFGTLPKNVNFLDSPSTTSSVVYKVQARQVDSTLFYINRSVNDSGSYNQRGISTITLMEIAG